MNKELCIHGVDLDIACNVCSPPFVNVDYYITPSKDKPRGFSQEEYKEDIAYLVKNLFESLRIPKDYLNENFTRCFYCSSVFSDNEFDDDYAICGKCRDKENEE